MDRGTYSPETGISCNKLAGSIPFRTMQCEWSNSSESLIPRGNSEYKWYGYGSVATNLPSPYQTTNTMKSTSLMILTMSFATLGMVACSEAPRTDNQMENQVDNTMEDIRKEKESISKDMRDMREKISKRMAEVETKLSDPAVDAETKAKFEQEKLDLKQQMDRVDGNLSSVENATKETWNDVKASSKEAADETENWFQRQKELIDQKTDVDHDKDGH